MTLNMEVDPEFAAGISVLLLGIHEGLQYQKSSTKRLSSLRGFYFVHDFSQSLSLRSDAVSHMEPQSVPFHVLALYYALMMAPNRKYIVHSELVTFWVKKLNINKSTDFPLPLFRYVYFYLFILSVFFLLLPSILSFT